MKFVHSVRRIVALIILANNHALCANTGRHVIFTWLKPYVNVRPLIFYVCEVSSQPIAQLNMQ